MLECLDINGPHNKNEKDFFVMFHMLRIYNNFIYLSY